MHPVQFGIMMIANLCIGLCTPPVGTCLFVGCSVGKTSLTAVTRPMIPFFLAMLIALLLTTYWEPMTMWLPSLLDLT
jgi:TRAP-type C4-dicarboxylate transport system permease large subunit